MAKKFSEQLRQDYNLPDNEMFSADGSIIGSVMSETQFRARQEANRKQFAGSGFVEWGDTPSGYKSLSKIEGLFLASKDNILKFSQDSKININGNVIVPFMYSDNIGRIKLPNPATSLFTIKDSTSLNGDMKQGDFAILKDTNRELASNGTFDDNIDGWENGDDNRGSTSYDSDNNRLKVINDSDGDYPYAKQTLQTIKNVKYKVKVSVTIGDADEARIYLGDTLLLECSDDIDYEGEWISNKNGDTDIQLYLYETGNTGHACYFDDISIKQVEEQPIVSLQDNAKDIDLYDSDYSDKFEARDSVSRQDLVFLESWEEDISDKGIVYPYGNTQYRGGNVEGLSGIVDGDFEGKDTYSLFGNWQAANDLVGKGYKWTDLSIQDKINLVSNPEHNIYLSRDGKFIQVRYRIRVVKGISNTVDIDYTSNFGTFSSYSYSEHTTNLDDTNIQISLVQRPNDGIFHKIYNPQGTAYLINDDGDDIVPFEEFALDDTNVNSLEDCWNMHKVAYKDSDDNYVAGDSSDAVTRTGIIASGITANESGRYADEINEMDVEDLRMSAKKKVIKELHDDERLVDINGERRGKEKTNGLVKITGTGQNMFYIPSNAFKVGNFIKLYTKEHPSYIYRTNISFESVTLDKYLLLLTKDGGLAIIHCETYQSGDQSIEGHIVQTSFGIEKFYNTTENYYNSTIDIFTMSNEFSNYTFNNTLTQTDIIGDPRKLSDRIEYTTGDDEQIDIHKNMYIKKGEDDGNNGGTKDHLYRYLGDDISNVHTNSTDGDANADDGHIDFSDDNLWLDLGDDLSIGAYKDEWLSGGFAGTPLIVGEEGQNINPINDLVEDSDGDYIRVKLSKKYNGNFSVYVQDKDGKFIEYIKGDENNEKEYSVNTTLNEIKLNTEDSYDDLGYGSEQEMLDLMKVVVIYETQTNTMELANNSEVLDVYPMAEKGYSSDLSEGVFITSNLINKIPTNNDIAKQLSTKGVDFTLLQNNELTSSESNVTPQHSSFDFSNSSDIPQVKIMTTLTQENNRMYLNYVFKELKYDEDTHTWGDDNKFQITDKVSTTTDDNDNTVIYGQKRVALNVFYKGDDK